MDPSQRFPDLEVQILERWRERDVFNESLRRREGAPSYVFYEGPPTANGRPGVHHVLARVFKDIYPRFKTMRGFRVDRKGGWDCHGLPVEIAVEQQLGLKSKQEIEDYGIEAFNKQCRESVFTFLEDWDALTERIGFWVDLDHAYRTLDSSYVESVWWALKEIFGKGLLYEGHRVVPYCPRCGTALSSHEVALGYKDVVDTSVYATFGVLQQTGPVQVGDQLVIWTTLPWTIVPNAAIAVHPALEYVRAAKDGKVYVVAKALADRVLGEESYEVLDTFTGADFAGAPYEPAFDYITNEEYGERARTVLTADFVSAEDGSGLVGTAIAFGEDDYKLGTGAGLNVINPVLPDGRFEDRIGPFGGMNVRAADAGVVEDLRARDRLLRAEDYKHSFPHCWRCSTPLLYYAKPSWYIRTSELREELKASNETVNWYPPHIKHGRFGDWLENNVDWALSRERYWGTPLPVWRGDDDPSELMCIGSLAELAELSGVTLDDPHRPYVDDVTFTSPVSGQTMRRVPEVIDVWFDSGSMPFAQHAAPWSAEGQAVFEQQYPADFICEAIDQTRGWFYSLIAVSTLLWGRSSFENVVCLGHIRDADDKKMSKSLGNIVVPNEVIDVHGADALRWYFFTAKQPWDGYRFSVDAVGESSRVLRQLWNTYAFLTLYTVEDGVEATETELDRWVRSRLAATVEAVTSGLESYDATGAGRAIGAFVDDLSNWYVRRSRPRFFDGDPGAFACLRECLETVSLLLAPFTPFVADEIYAGVGGTEPSVHLCDWPAAGQRDVELEEDMAVAREAVRMGLAARGGSKIKIRQPLREAVVVAAGRERAAIERLASVIADELNVKTVRLVEAADELGSYALKANYRSLGPRFGKSMPQAAAAIEALDAADVAAAFREGRHVGVSVEGHDHELGPDDIQLVLQPLDGYQIEREGTHAVALDLTITEELRVEGLARDIVRAVQNTRKDAGLDVSDRIELSFRGDAGLLDVARQFEEYIAGETLATTVAYDMSDEEGVTVTIDQKPLRIGVRKV